MSKTLANDLYLIVRANLYKYLDDNLSVPVLPADEPEAGERAQWVVPDVANVTPAPRRRGDVHDDVMVQVGVFSTTDTDTENQTDIWAADRVADDVRALLDQTDVPLYDPDDGETLRGYLRLAEIQNEGSLLSSSDQERVKHMLLRATGTVVAA